MKRKEKNFMKKIHKIIPKFINEDEEREFWDTHSPLDYFGAGDIKRASFPKLKPPLKSLSMGTKELGMLQWKRFLS
jgi:hypothetical protein